MRKLHTINVLVETQEKKIPDIMIAISQAVGPLVDTKNYTYHSATYNREPNKDAIALIRTALKSINGPRKAIGGASACLVGALDELGVDIEKEFGVPRKPRK